MIWSMEPWVGLKWWLWLLLVEWPAVTGLFVIIRELIDAYKSDEDDAENEEGPDNCANS